MTSREKVLSALNFQETGYVPVDLSGHRSSGISAIAYNNLRNYLGLESKPIRVYDMVQQLAIVAMMIEGGGWDVIDLGVDVDSGKYIESLKEHPGSVIGISALLTTTMVNMEAITKQIKEEFPGTKVLIGGAPVTKNFKIQIGADFYSPEAQSAVAYLNAQVE